MAAPAFKCTDVGPTCLTLHYHSHRPALGPIVVGVLKGLAEHYPYQTALEQWEPPVSVGNHQNASASAATFPAAAARSFTLSPESFYQLFPFHLLLDRSCRVVQAGSVLERLFPELQGRSGVPLGDVFQMRAPCMSISYESLHAAQADTVLLRAHTTGLDMKGQVLVVRTRASSQPGAKGGGPVQVGAERGQHQPQQAGAEPQQALQGEPTERVQGEEEGLLFLGSPWLAGLAGMRQHGIFISDIPRHDATRDFVMLAEQRHAEAQLKERLESLTLELKEANSRLGEMTGWLDEERRRSDGLLYQMLPPEVASCLKNEERAPAREHPEATVLFSDIVGFTEIASRSSPLEVCSLLDELYQRFDAAIEEHPQLYKVETIGDAYMVVCNVTVPCDDHADVLLEFALRMHEEASLVASSLGEPVRIRVGMHSGPVVAGVVGRKMPRFCLFGDTVNTASRMESHGEAGKIHISEACYSCLRAKERFLIRERGNITVKGKGTMRTYLIAPAPAPDPPGPTAASTHRFVARRASVAGTVPATPTVEVPLGYAAGDYSNEFSRASTSSCASCVTSVDGFSQFVLQPGGGPGSGRSSLRSPRAPQSPSNPLVALASSGTPFAAIAGGSVRDVSLRDDSAPLARLSDASGGGTSSSGAAAGAADEAGRGGELLGRRVSDMGAMSADSVVRRPVPRRRSQLSRVQELVAKEGEPEAADSTQE
ncbi:hypothetical protein HXX76_003859 [Chlamydomonas incerta]|uniref:guanylate cyclase n=1 Tax=Chlamydomonas incerta TaxID=51695 RepID=A0A835TLR4_CHLIN|nr:hypothetical protein HXX76_003859 [Chlamydomonas incerta]|eukprot:KAG2441006.1 hypothetical protein HXX76_003859 [Chlamydomonas incerta]